MFRQLVGFFIGLVPLCKSVEDGFHSLLDRFIPLLHLHLAIAGTLSLVFEVRSSEAVPFLDAHPP